jgi:nucleosome assembly protein 1-like 1
MQVDIEEKIEEKIKALPTLKEKVQAIAINGYLIEKRELDKKMDQEIEALHRKFRETFTPQLNEINAIVEGKHAFTDADFEDIGDLLTPEELTNKHNYLTNEKIPEFWLKAFLNSDVLAEQIEERD